MTANDEKLKPLMPTLRQKKRFVKFVVESDKKFNFRDISFNLMDKCMLYLGLFDMGKSGFWLLRDKFDERTQTGVLKVSTKEKERILGCLALITKIEDTPVRIKVLRVSGTLKGLQS